MLLEHALSFAAALGTFAIGLQCYLYFKRSRVTTPAGRMSQRLQSVFLPGYLMAAFSDWLQGPYAWVIYRAYGLSKGDIGVLFVFGYLSTALASSIVGRFADVYGRRLACLMFCLVYVATCISVHFSNFYVLAVGRFMAGIGTSLLFSAFDAWLVSEAHRTEIGSENLDDIFSTMVFGNGIVAILAGFIANLAVQTFGQVASFEVSLMSLIICAAIITSLWKENYGRRRADVTARDINRATTMAAYVIATPKIFYCGLLQIFFQTSVDIYIFQWTPSLPSTISYGVVFSSFMAANCMGSLLSSVLLSKDYMRHLVLLKGTFAISGVALAIAALVEHPDATYISFLVLNVMIGTFHSTYFGMRAAIVPDENRATILALYQVPLNILVVLFLLGVRYFSNSFACLIAAGFQCAALACSFAGSLSAKGEGTQRPTSTMDLLETRSQHSDMLSSSSIINTTSDTTGG